MQATTKVLGFLVIAALVGCDKERDPVTVGTGNQGASGTGGKVVADGGGGAAGGSGGSTSGGGGAAGTDAGDCAPSDCKVLPLPLPRCGGQFVCARDGNKGCQWLAPRCPDEDGGAQPPATDAGNATGPKCGTTTCAAGMTCCNASCGICAPPNGACIQIACDPKPPVGGACRTDADCRLFDDYCTGCDCRALAKGEPDPKCAGPGVRCFAQPCMNKVAACQNGRCAVVAK